MSRSLRWREGFLAMACADPIMIDSVPGGNAYGAKRGISRHFVAIQPP